MTSALVELGEQRRGLRLAPLLRGDAPQKAPRGETAGHPERVQGGRHEATRREEK